MALAQDKQKKYSDKKRSGNLTVFMVGHLVLLDTKNLPLILVSSVGSNKLKHRFIGSFAVLVRHGAVYIIDVPKSTATHPTYYVGRLKRGHLTMRLIGKNIKAPTQFL
ncbi:Pol protein [Phytophthora palmivora]|uniref:Pol protein n=1 Tax=Phytophthora palmivora TaxID=4796 RepID=A0A2P4XN04_9STRA|nr:Pol protein [Phytophthora palmivora]